MHAFQERYPSWPELAAALAAWPEADQFIEAPVGPDSIELSWRGPDDFAAHLRLRLDGDDWVFELLMSSKGARATARLCRDLGRWCKETAEMTGQFVIPDPEQARGLYLSVGMRETSEGELVGEPADLIAYGERKAPDADA